MVRSGSTIAFNAKCKYISYQLKLPMYTQVDNMTCVIEHEKINAHDANTSLTSDQYEDYTVNTVLPAAASCKEWQEASSCCRFQESR